MSTHPTTQNLPNTADLQLRLATELPLQPEASLIEAKQLFNWGVDFSNQGQPAAAAACWAGAVRHWSRLIEQDGQRQFAADRASTWMNLGNAFSDLNRADEAIAQYKLALAAYNALIEQDGQRQFAANRAHTWVNLGTAFSRLNRADEAIAQYKLALAAYNALIEQDGQRQFAADRASTWMNLGIAFSNLNRADEAIAQYTLALAAYNALIEQDGQRQFAANRASTWMNLGNAFSRLNRADEAIAQYKLALAAYNALIEQDGQRQFAANRAHTWVNLGNAFLRLNRADDAIAQYTLALAAYNALIEQDGQRQFAANRASTWMNLGNAFSDLNRADEAIAQYKLALAAYNALIEQDGQRQFAADRAHTWMNLGTAFSRLNRADEAIAQYKLALAAYNALIEQDGQRQFAADRAHTWMNLGNAFSDLNRADEAIAQYKLALAAYNALIEQDGQRQFAADRAHTWMNLGNAFSRLNRADEAIAQYKLALAAYNALIEQDGQRQFAADRAHTWMNLGNAFSNLNRADEAIAQYTLALAAYNALIEQDGQRQFAANRASTWMNLGNAFSNLNRADEAIAQYTLALAAYNALIEQDGQRQFAADRASTWMNLGTVFSRLNRADEAIEQYMAALYALSTDVVAGQWQHLALAVTAFERTCEWGMQMMDSNTAKALASLAAATGALEALANVQTDFRNIHLQALGRLQVVLSSAYAVWRERELPNPALHLRGALMLGLTWLQNLLRDADPLWLQTQKPQEGLVLPFWKLCSELGGDLPLAWALATQGVRSQRALLADTDDAELKALNEVWRALDQAANRLYGQAQGQAPAAPFDLPDGGRAMQPSTGELYNTAALAYDEWQALNKQKNTLLDAARQSGKLPKIRALTLLDVRKKLATGECLMMVVPHTEPGHLCVLLAFNGAPVPQALNQPRNEAATLLHLQMPLNLVDQRGRLLAYAAAHAAGASELATAEDTLLMVQQHTLGQLRNGNNTSRALRKGDLSTDAAEAEGCSQELIAAADAYMLALEAALASALAPALAAGCTTWHVVATGTLQLLPWRKLLAGITAGITAGLETGRGQTRLYPHLGSWHQSTAPTLQPQRAPQWATVAYTPPRGHPEWLAFVPLEQELSHKLWQGFAQGTGLRPRALTVDQLRWPDAPDAAPVSALLAIGHGDEKAQANLALAGLWVGLSADNKTKRYLHAHHLNDIKHATKLLLSCCVGAKTTQVATEPMGLVAGAFDFGTQMAFGALLNVDDFEAMLFALAYQWALRTCYETQKHEPDWIEIFEQTQSRVASGRWPAGFAAWLDTSLPALSCAASPAGLEDAEARNNRQQLHTKLQDLCRELHGGTLPAGLRGWQDDWQPTLRAIAQGVGSGPSPYLRQLVYWYAAFGR